MFFELSDIGRLHLLRPVCKRFNQLASRSVTLVANGIKHQLHMVRLFDMGATGTVRQMNYTVPFEGDILSAYGLSNFVALTFLELDGMIAVLIRELTKALAKLTNLVTLKIIHFNSVEDQEFSVADHLPSVRHLRLISDGDIASLLSSPCHLISLELSGNHIASAISCIDSIKVLRFSQADFLDNPSEQLAGLEAFAKSFQDACVSLFSVLHISPWSQS